MKTTNEKKLFNALATAVRAAMKTRGVGLRELARDADVPVGTLHHWIGATSDAASKRNGHKQRAGGPRFAIVAAVVDVLGIDLASIVADWARVAKKATTTNGKRNDAKRKKQKV